MPGKFAGVDGNDVAPSWASPITTPPATGSAPPDSPVPAPRGTKGHNLTGRRPRTAAADLLRRPRAGITAAGVTRIAGQSIALVPSGTSTCFGEEPVQTRQIRPSAPATSVDDMGE